jgi:amino acid adenylation domain-containing protein
LLTPPVPGARYDLELVLMPSESGALLCCDYSTELFDRETVARWMRSLLELLGSALADPTQAIGRLPMLSSRERDQVLTTWNATREHYGHETLLEVIQDRAAERPDGTAICFHSDNYSYRWLLQRSTAIGSRLRARGVAANDRVAMLLPRGPDLVAAILAVWQIRAIYVPLDPALPAQRKASMLAGAAVKTVLTVARLQEQLGTEWQPSALLLDAGDSSTHADATVGSAQQAEGSDSAYIMYTSGSTGQPKGIEVTHAAITNTVLATRQLLKFGNSDSWLAVSTIGFDISLAELLVPLVAGGTIHLAEESLAADGFKLLELLQFHEPTHIQLTPSSWSALLAAGWSGSSKAALISTGERLSRALAEQLLPRGRALWNLYGPTETAIWSAACRVESEPNQPVHIGRPFPNSQLYVLDEQLQPVPIGCVGELCVSGAGLARGYWDQPR